MAELDALDPIPETVKLVSGIEVELERLKARQFFKLLRIVTNGALPQMANAGLFDMEGLDKDEFTTRLVSVLLMSIPEAEEQTIDFVRSMVIPTGLVVGKKVNKADEDRNLTLWLALDAELDNPELDDLVTIIEAVVRREASDIQALGKRLSAMFKLAQKTGQVPNAPSPNPTESTLPSSEDSPARSTSSRASTATRTTKSATSRSRGSASASRRSGKDSSTGATNASNG